MNPPFSGYQALLARTSTIHRPAAPLVYDCVRLTVVRDGSAILFGEFGKWPISVGDVVLLGPNVLCGVEPEGHITVSTIYLDTDYVLDQVFWRHVDLLHDRFDTPGFAETVCTDPAQVLRVGKDRTGILMPWLDELVALSIGNAYRERFHRMQALWFSIIDEVAPYIRLSPIRASSLQWSRIRPTAPRVRRFTPLRAEAREVQEALRRDLSRSWTLPVLASMVHLSPKQLSRVFADAFGKTPLAYLTMLRVQEMARLLRASNLTIAEAGRQVGWHSRNRASAAFQECAGVTPSRFRTMARADGGVPTFGTSVRT